MPDIEKKPTPAPEPVIEKATKTKQYFGPKPAPLIGNLPGTSDRYHADDLPEQYRQFVIETVPGAKDWWR